MLLNAHQRRQYPRNSWSSSNFLCIPTIYLTHRPSHLFSEAAGTSYKIIRPFYILAFEREILLWSLAGLMVWKDYLVSECVGCYRFGLNRLIWAAKIYKTWHTGFEKQQQISASDLDLLLSLSLEMKGWWFCDINLKSGYSWMKSCKWKSDCGFYMVTISPNKSSRKFEESET